MTPLEEYPKHHRNCTKALRELLTVVPELSAEQRADFATIINDMADSACDLDDIFQRLLRPNLTKEELAELLIAFELTTEQLHGNAGIIDGKLYDMADRLRGIDPCAVCEEDEEEIAK